MTTIVERQPPAGMSIDLEDRFMVSNLASANDASTWSRLLGDFRWTSLPDVVGRCAANDV